MSSLLADNLANTPSSEIEAFVQEFWDLIRNPFQPVQKGMCSGSRNSAGALKGGNGYIALNHFNTKFSSGIINETVR